MKEGDYVKIWLGNYPPVPMRSGAPEYGTKPEGEVEGELEKAG